MNQAEAAPQYVALITTSEISALNNTPSLLNRLKRQCYQHPDAQWRVILVLPSLLSYAYQDSERYHADWSRAMELYHALSQTVTLTSEQIQFIHGHPKKIMRQYKRKYPDWVFPMNRTFFEKHKIMGCWVWRKIKRKFHETYLSLKGNTLIHGMPEDYWKFLLSVK